MRRTFLHVLVALSVVAGLVPGVTARANVITDGLVLNFPAAGISFMPVYEGYRDSSGEVAVPYTPTGAWHYPGTAWPGQGSNTLLFSHDQPTYFGGMDGWYFDPGSHIGQSITLTRTNGLVMHYTVTSVTLVNPGDISILAATTFDQLTLLTCTSFNSADPKQVVRAKLDPVPPSKPLNISATAGQNSAVVRWAPPDFFGYNAPTSYTVTAYPNGGSVSVPGYDTSAGLNLLTPGQSYSFTVIASNSAGSGPPDGSNAVIPYPRLTATAAGSVAAGSPLSVSVTAVDGHGFQATGYSSSLQFTSSDSRATLPANGTPIGSGAGSYPVTLVTAGTQSISIRDSYNPGIAASVALTVVPGPVQRLGVAVAPLIAEQTSTTVTVSALDGYGNPQPNYAGTVHLSAPAGSLATAPSDHAFAPGDGGVFGFSVVPAAAATGTSFVVGAADTVATALTASVNVTVGNAFYFTWYDRISSPGFLADNIHVINPNSTAVDVLVAIPAGFTGPCPTVTAHLAPNEERFFSCPNGFGGPAQVVATLPVQASQRVQYYSSFNEVAAQPFSAAQTHLVFNWFDRISSVGFQSDNVHVMNPGSQPAQVTVTIPGSYAGPCPATTVNIDPGMEAIVTCASGFGGPVTVDSNAPVLASQRVQYFQSFNEVSANATTAASTALSFTWFDRASSPAFISAGDNIHVVNPGAPGSVAHVTVRIKGCGDQGGAIAGGGYGVFTCPGGFGGPVTVSSADLPVLAGQRVQFGQSFNEVPAQPASTGMLSINFPWFDRISSPGFVSDNIHVMNPDTTTASVVTVQIPPGFTGPCPTNGQAVTIPAGGEAIFSCANGFGGPVVVTVISGPAVLASQRVQYYQSFNEVPSTLIGS